MTHREKIECLNATEFEALCRIARGTYGHALPNKELKRLRAAKLVRGKTAMVPFAPFGLMRTMAWGVPPGIKRELYRMLEESGTPEDVLALYR